MTCYRLEEPKSICSIHTLQNKKYRACEVACPMRELYGLLEFKSSILSHQSVKILRKYFAFDYLGIFFKKWFENSNIDVSVRFFYYFFLYVTFFFVFSN